MTYPFGIYTHVPWCKKRCAYCSFNIFVEKSPPFVQWRDGIMRDWNREKAFFEGEAQSLYFGGGTPSLAPSQIIKSIIDFLPHQENAEITLEINPGDISSKHLSAMQKAGVNRYSIGIQSFLIKYARLLNRSHSVEDNHALLKDVRAQNPRSWSMDIIFALPDQSLEELRWDIDQALLHEPPHISIYGLTIEEGTPLYRSVKAGKTIPLDPDRWADQFYYIMDRLEQEGYTQYEVSNFAREGHRSMHNEAIWKNGFYAGLGPGAHGFRPIGTRTLQKESWDDWRSRNHLVLEHPDQEQILYDKIITSLRHIDGLPLETIAASGYLLPSKHLESFQEQGWVVMYQNQIILTKKGKCFADGITSKIVQYIEPFEH